MIVGVSLCMVLGESIQAERIVSRRVVSVLVVIRGVVVDLHWMHSMLARIDLMFK